MRFLFLIALLLASTNAQAWRQGKASGPTADISCSAGTPVYSSKISGPSASYGVALPAACVDETMPTVTGNVTAVHDTGNVTTNGTNFQNALNAACLGDEIVLDAGVKYDRAGFSLPNISCSHGAGGWLIITSSALASLPPPGTRIDPTDLANMPILETTSTNYAVFNTTALIPVHNIRIIGVAMTDTSAISSESYYLCSFLGDFGQTTSTSQLTNHIIFDRVWCAPYSSSLMIRHGFLIDGQYNAVVDSYVDGLWDTQTDSQAIFSITGGPILIRNDYLVASGENMIWGGDDNKNVSLNPSDITVYNSTLAKLWAWLPGSYDIKELFEMKNSTRLLIFNNLMYNNAAQGQAGYAMLFRSVNQDGACTWCVVLDTTLQQNVIVNSPRGLNIATQLGNVTTPTTDVDIYDNLLYQIGTTYPLTIGTDSGNHTMVNVNYVNNTFWGTGTLYAAVYFSFSPQTASIMVNGFDFANNVWSTSSYGVIGDSPLGQGDPSLAALTTGTVVLTNNIIPGGVSGDYTSHPGNYFGSNPSVVNAACGNYALSSPGSYGPPPVGAQHIPSCTGSVPANFTCSFQHAGNCNSVPIPNAVTPQIGFVQASNVPYQGYSVSSCATCPSGTSDLTIDFAGVLSLTATGRADASHGATWSPTISAANGAGTGSGVVSVTFQ